MSVNQKATMAEKLIFAQTFEGLVRSIGPGLTPELRRGMRELGFNCDARLEPAYSIEVFCAVVEFVARSLYPSMSLDEAIAILRALEREA
jgi:uncharacterized protein (TIGR02265 family)